MDNLLYKGLLTCRKDTLRGDGGGDGGDGGGGGGGGDDDDGGDDNRESEVAIYKNPPASIKLLTT